MTSNLILAPQSHTVEFPRNSKGGEARGGIISRKAVYGGVREFGVKGSDWSFILCSG